MLQVILCTLGPAGRDGQVFHLSKKQGTRVLGRGCGCLLSSQESEGQVLRKLQTLLLRSRHKVEVIAKPVVVINDMTTKAHKPTAVQRHCQSEGAATPHRHFARQQQTAVTAGLQYPLSMTDARLLNPGFTSPPPEQVSMNPELNQILIRIWLIGRSM